MNLSPCHRRLPALQPERLQAYGTIPVAINNEGIIAGYYYDENYVAHGFVRRLDGTFNTFDAPGAGTGLYQGTGCPGCFLGLNQWGDRSLLQPNRAGSNLGPKPTDTPLNRHKRH